MSCQSKCGSSLSPQFVNEAVITIKSSKFNPRSSCQSKITVKNADYYNCSRPVNSQTTIPTKHQPNWSSISSVKSNVSQNPPSLKIISGNKTASRSSTNLSTFSSSYNSTKSAPDLRTVGCSSTTIKSPITFQRTVGKPNSSNLKAGSACKCPGNPSSTLPKIVVRHS